MFRHLNDTFTVAHGTLQVSLAVVAIGGEVHGGAECVQISNPLGALYGGFQHGNRLSDLSGVDEGDAAVNLRFGQKMLILEITRQFYQSLARLELVLLPARDVVEAN